MAEFQEVIKQFKRLCDSANQDCSSCGLENMSCSIKDIVDNSAAFEKRVSAWAAKHPEPVYPTWAEWLNSIGVIIGEQPFPALNIPVYVYQASTKMLEPIPANIAEKLGIIPKESN